MYFIYVLKSERFSKSYVGYTDNVERRLEEHNSGRGNFTSTYKPWKLVYTETFEKQSDALEREKFLKSRSGRMFLKEAVFK